MEVFAHVCSSTTGFPNVRILNGNWDIKWLVNGNAGRKYVKKSLDNIIYEDFSYVVRVKLNI